MQQKLVCILAMGRIYQVAIIKCNVETSPHRGSKVPFFFLTSQHFSLLTCEKNK